jgi:hypothetical protein
MATIMENINDNNLSEYLYNKFKSTYPDINPTTIDKDLLKDMIFNFINEDSISINKISNEMFDNINNLSKQSNEDEDKKNPNPNPNPNPKIQIEQNKFELELIEQNILMGDEIIPEFSIPSDLIYLGGRIGPINLKIMVDTGATSCVMFKSVVEKCGLDYLIDTSTSVMVQGAHGMKPTLGTISFLEIDLEITKDQWVSVPISVVVIDDSETIKANKIISEHNDKINKIIGIKDDNNNNLTNKIPHGFELILGMVFLKSYRANIDFSTMIITLNKNIKIKFN